MRNCSQKKFFIHSKSNIYEIVFSATIDSTQTPQVLNCMQNNIEG